MLVGIEQKDLEWFVGEEDIDDEIEKAETVNNTPVVMRDIYRVIIMGRLGAWIRIKGCIRRDIM